MSKIKHALAGALVAFIWGALSWMVLPWHMSTLKSVSNEDIMVQALRANADKKAIYYIPGSQGAEAATVREKMKHGPVAFMAINPSGSDPTNPFLYIRGFLIQFLGAFLFISLIRRLQIESVWVGLRLGFVCGLFAGIVTHLPHWNWWGFSTEYTVVNILDQVITWSLVGAVIGRLERPRRIFRA